MICIHMLSSGALKGEQCPLLSSHPCEHHHEEQVGVSRQVHSNQREMVLRNYSVPAQGQE